MAEQPKRKLQSPAVGRGTHDMGTCVGCPPLGSPYSKEWFPLVARGSKLAGHETYPKPAEVADAWQEVTALLLAAMEKASDELLAGPAPEKIPSVDGKLSGTVSFLAWHDSFHASQAVYLRSWIDHSRTAS